MDYAWIGVANPALASIGRSLRRRLLRRNWTELNWTELNWELMFECYFKMFHVKHFSETLKYSWSSHRIVSCETIVQITEPKWPNW